MDRIEDLMDFYRRWPDLRSNAEAILDSQRLDEEQRAVLEWMMFVVDRVGPADLENDKD